MPDFSTHMPGFSDSYAWFDSAEVVLDFSESAEVMPGFSDSAEVMPGFQALLKLCLVFQALLKLCFILLVAVVGKLIGQCRYPFNG